MVMFGYDASKIHSGESWSQQALRLARESEFRHLIRAAAADKLPTTCLFLYFRWKVFHHYFFYERVYRTSCNSLGESEGRAEDHSISHPLLVDRCFVAGSVAMTTRSPVPPCCHDFEFCFV